MRKLALLIACFLLAVPEFAVFAQEEEAECDVAAIAAEYADILQNVTELSELKAVNLELAAAIGSCEGVSSAEGTLEDPIPLGEYVRIGAGKFRVLSVTDPYEESSVAPPAGFRTVAVEVELVCESDDGTCFASSATLSELLSSTGEPATDSEHFAEVSDEPYFDGMMGPSGTTLTGLKYYLAIEDSDASYLGLFNLSGDGPLEMFFSLEE